MADTLSVKLAETNAELRALREELARDYAPREETDRRLRRSGLRVAIALVAVVALAALLVGLNRATLQQAQRQAATDIRTLVTACRTTTPTISPADLAYCRGRVPGFDQARKRAAETAATAARNERRLARLEAQVAELRRRR